MSTEVAPPPYTPSDIVRVIKGLTDKSAVTIDIATSKPSDEEVIKQIEENLDPLRLALSDGVEYEKMEKETRSLSQHVFAIQADFIKIRDILREFDAKNYKDKDNNVIALESKWTPFQERFGKLIWDSRDLAANGKASCDQFIRVHLHMLDDPTATLIDKKAEFQAFIEEMSKFKGEAQTTTDAFIHLRDDISTFVQSLDAYIALAQKGLDVDIDRLQGEINKLNEQIATWKADISRCVGIINSTGGGIGTGGLVAVGILAPFTLFGALVTYAALKAKAKREEAARKQEARNEMNTAQQKVTAAQESITQKTAEREALIHERDVGLGQLMKARFEDANVASADIHKRLTAISNIWGFLHSDAVQILTHLNSAQSAPTNYGFKNNAQVAAAENAVPRP